MTEEINSLRKSRQQFLAEAKIAFDLGGTLVLSRPLPFLLKEKTPMFTVKKNKRFWKTDVTYF